VENQLRMREAHHLKKIAENDAYEALTQRHPMQATEPLEWSFRTTLPTESKLRRNVNRKRRERKLTNEDT